MARKTNNLGLWLPDIGTGNTATLLNQNFEKIDQLKTIIDNAVTPGGNITEDITMKQGAVIKLEAATINNHPITLQAIDNGDDAKLTINAKDIELIKANNQSISLTDFYNNLNTAQINITNIGTYGTSQSSSNTSFQQVYQDIKKIGKWDENNITSATGYLANIQKYYGNYTKDETKNPAELGKVFNDINTINKTLTDIGTWNDKNEVSTAGYLTNIKNFYGDFSNDGTGVLSNIYKDVVHTNTSINNGYYLVTIQIKDIPVNDTAPYFCSTYAKNFLTVGDKFSFITFNTEVHINIPVARKKSSGKRLAGVGVLHIDGTITKDSKDLLIFNPSEESVYFAGFDRNQAGSTTEYILASITIEGVNSIHLGVAAL